jgi:hypothetical protein
MPGTSREMLAGVSAFHFSSPLHSVCHIPEGGDACCPPDVVSS